MQQPPRTIVLTGVTRGLGRALAEAFLADGHRVAGCGRSVEALKELGAAWPGALFDAVDVARVEEVEAWAGRVHARFGGADLVLNNAAMMNRVAPLWQVASEEFDRLMAVNVSGTHNVVRAFAPAMIAAGSGVIVNFSSGWGRSAAAEIGPYCASKWAIEGYTRSLAQDLPRGLAAIALNPGIIDTAMLRKCWAAGAAGYEGPESWVRRAAPFLLKLGARDNGAALSIP